MMIKSLIQQMGPMGPHGDSSVSTSTTTLLWVIIILLVVIIVYLWYTGNRKHTETPEETVEDTPEAENIETDKITVALRLLNDNEKLIVQALIGHGGEMLQKDISYELELTRVQTHRTVQSLIEREIVTTEDHYNTKKVTLAKWLIQ
jgi:uncharacterized membrane protein